MAAIVLGDAINGIVAGALLTAAVWAALRSMKRWNSSTRYAVWLGALVANVALVFLAGAGRAAAVVAPVAAAGAPASELPVLTLPEGSWALWVLGAWLAGTILMLGRLAFSYRAVRALKRSARPVELLAGANGVVLATSPGVPVPLAVGLRKPMIVVPEWLLDRLSPAEFDQIVLHELAHIRRRDDWTNLLQKLVEAIFFFHPAVHWIGRQLNLEREIACDDWVVSATGHARPYAACLTKLAALHLFGRRAQLAPGAVSRKSETSRRVEALLAGRPANPRFSVFGLAGAALGIVLASGAALQLAPVAVAERAAPALAMPAQPAAQALAYAAHPRAPRLAQVRRVAAPRPAPEVRYLLILDDSGPRTLDYCIFIFWEPPPPPAVHRLA